MGAVRGILLDSSVVLSSDASHGDAVVALAAEYLLGKLRYSRIPIGILCEQDLSSPKVNLIQEVATKYFCTVFCSSTDDISSVIAQSWEDRGGDVVHVVSSRKMDFHPKGNDCTWLKVIVGNADREPSTDAEYVGATGISNLFISQLEELLLLICQLNKKAIGEEALIVGYVMKPSREGDFAKRGAFPMHPTENGLIFLPLNYDLPLAPQFQLLDAVLHKATDEILAVDMDSPLGSIEQVTFTNNLQELCRHIKCHLDCCVIDPFNNVLPILDRFRIQQILFGLEKLNIHGHCKIRPPHFLKVDRFDESDLEQKLAQAKLSLPTIVKPQVACGVSEAHSMAIVFKIDQYKDLNIPLPAVVQEYVNHMALIYKFYALGGKIFYAVKKSIPNADNLMSLSPENGMKPLLFDSLKSLPVAKEQVNVTSHQIDLDLVNHAADWLRRTLDLTIFGFDVVVQEGTGDHVIVDVNYLPSFKEVPDDVAIPAFWDALKEKILSGKCKNTS
ncbi:inositol 1,3,4-trisphosphate 5/6-kinase 4-like isoform X2 [Andrographis paniculata]|uniref:inositol 1,3,4-trisphosphate 5/6-kinase 4-like isoform X2 n=1 Tax=Andrographis paniculata TaxID=175694 RepID=UPI0021E7EE74|nr:inositol 1,3,4-trisphosphate 5/6-kinase 4-like isoform X2 [Andrographis paniculata]